MVDTQTIVCLSKSHKSSNFIFNPIKPFAMKSKILLLALSVAAFSSCTTAYKTGQTPDDVYFSPARPQDEYVRIDKEDSRRYRSDNEYYDDRYLRMKVNNRSRWNDFNDWYSYEKYGSGYNYIYESYNNPYNSWNYYYNPYYYNPVIINSKNTTAYNRPRTFNLNTYNTSTPVNTNRNIFKYTGSEGSNNTYTAPRNSNSRSNSNSGNVLRDIFSSSNNNNSSSNSNSGKTNTSSSSSSSSSSPSSSGSTPAPVRRF